MDNNYAQLKQVCQQACHDRHACSEGYVAMLNADNVSQMMATWRKYWDDVVKSKYVEVIRLEFPALYVMKSTRPASISTNVPKTPRSLCASS